MRGSDILAERHVDRGLVTVSDAVPDKPEPTEGNVHVCLDFDDVVDVTGKLEAPAPGFALARAESEMFYLSLRGGPELLPLHRGEVVLVSFDRVEPCQPGRHRRPRRVRPATDTTGDDVRNRRGERYSDRTDDR